MRLMDLLNWIFAPGDWETIICPKLVGSAGEVTVELCGVEAQFSPRRNARCLKGIESSDFALLLQMEAKRQLLCVQPARAERRMWCEGCKAMLSPQYDLQSCEFTVSPEVFADFEVDVTMSGVLCEACGRANFATRLFQPASEGDLLGRDILDALEQACRQIES